MKKGILFICALFLMLTGFNQQERVVEQSNANLLGRVSVAVGKPEIRQPLKDLSINKGKIATFIAELKQPDAKCTVTWYKDSVLVEENDRIKTYFDGITATLIMNKAVKDDAGKYKVILQNTAGKVESKARLTVIEK